MTLPYVPEGFGTRYCAVSLVHWNYYAEALATYMDTYQRFADTATEEEAAWERRQIPMGHFEFENAYLLNFCPIIWGYLSEGEALRPEDEEEVEFCRIEAARVVPVRSNVRLVHR